MHRRINITLPEETVQLIDAIVKKGDRNRLIDKAVRRFVINTSRANMNKLLKEGALRRTERDLRLAEESFFLEAEGGNSNADLTEAFETIASDVPDTDWERIPRGLSKNLNHRLYRGQ